MHKLKTYLVCVTHNNPKKGLKIIEQFLNSPNKEEGKLLLIENGSWSNFQNYKDRFGFYDVLEIHFSDNPNKSASLNYLVGQVIKDKEAIIICIDDDVEFPEYFMKNYKTAASEQGNIYYFGGSLKATIPNDVDEKIWPYLSISATGKSDEAYSKQKDLMFLGANYAFFKSQWTFVKGFDERFSAGSKYGLGADESIFQKKLKHVGYKPYLVKNNPVLHLTDSDLYTRVRIIARIQNNGYTHGFQLLILKGGFSMYMKRGFYLSKRCLFLLFSGSFLKFNFRFSYLKGHILALWLFLTITNRSSYLKGLSSNSVKID
jgi:hypothetical protein